jgi:hypothetical protein
VGRAIVYLETFYYRMVLWFNHMRYPESIWYGGSIKRETALKMVGKGWSGLINNIYDAKPKHTKIVDVKEKFATLRVYTSYAPDWFENLIWHYEGKSSETCEQCGKPGKIRENRGWYLTLCEDCGRISREEVK